MSQISKQLTKWRAPSAAAMALAVAAVTAIAFISPGAAGARSAARTSVVVKIVGENHAPVETKNWSYTVTVTDSHGHPLAGTVTTEFTSPGMGVVGRATPENVKFTNGRFHNTITFPAEAVGFPLGVMPVVKTKDGTGSATWNVKVVK